MTFSQVASAGTTAFAQIDPASAGNMPSAYSPVGGGLAYDVMTTASFTPPLTVCFVVNTVNDATEFARVRVLHGENGQLVDRTILAGANGPNFATRSVCALVDSLSPFVAAMAPATAYQVSGQVLTPDGRGLRNATVSLIDSKGERRSVASSSLGFFSFDGVLPGEVVTVVVSSKRFRFANQVVQANEGVTTLQFVGLE